MKAEDNVSSKNSSDGHPGTSKSGTSSESSTLASGTKTRGTSSQASRPSTSSSRPQLYLLDNKLSMELPRSKLPKNKHILRRFIGLYGDRVGTYKSNKSKKLLRL